MKRIAISASLLGLAGCMTTSGEPAQHPQPSIAPTESAALAERTAVELAHLARFDPERLEEVGAELGALANALFYAENAATASDDPVPAPSLSAPPAELLDAPSLRHGVHLASYRLESNARSGWQELVRGNPELTGLQARVERRLIDERGEFLRLKAGPFDSRDQASALCQQLQAREHYCMPVDFSGDALPE